MKSIAKLLALAPTLVVASALQAQITYVDVTDGASGNTTLTNGSVWTAQPESSQYNHGDGLWAVRPYGNSSTIYQNVASGGYDDAEPLLTTVSGLPLNTYDVYVYFWSDVSDWQIRAGLSMDSLTQFGFQTHTAGTTVYRAQDGTTAYSDSLSPNPFTTAVMINEGNRTLIQGYVGQVTDTTGISVFVDDPLGGVTDSNNRTWYDGIGYALVPEPTSVALLGLGASALFFLRRRRNA